MKLQLKSLLASMLVMLGVAACQPQEPVARLQASPRTLTLPYPHTATLELTWQPLRPLDIPTSELIVFVHLIDQEGKVQRTFDHPFPEAWAEGNEVRYPLDLHQSAIAPPIPPGNYKLTVGLYAASGRRWPLEVDAPEVDDEEYALIEVDIPYPVMATPRFTFSDAWKAPQDTGFRQIMAHRWLSEEQAELMIWGIDRPGEAVLRFTIPQLQEQALRLRTTTSDTVPAVAIASDCGGVQGQLSGYGSHEIRIAVQASVTGQRCTVRFSPGFYFVNSESSRRFSALLESTTWVPREVAHNTEMEPDHRRTITRSPEEYSLSLARAATPETVMLRNTGDEIVVNPRVIVNRRKDWFNIDTMLAEIVEPGFSDAEKAMAIWEFLVANRYHDIPTREHVEMHDPVRLLNVYGYGFCDDVANSFRMLARKAGVPARIWSLSGHVVAEAFYDGDWRMFDADGEVFYRAANDEIASVKRLSRDAELIRRNPSPNPLYFDTEHLVDLYTSRGDNRVASWYRGQSRHVMAFDLRPGESILRSRKHWQRHVANIEQTEPDVYGNGRFSFEPVLRDELFRQGATTADDLRVEASAEGERLLVFASDDLKTSARLTYPFNSPYPLLSGQVQLLGELRGSGTVELEFSEDGEHWSQVWTSSDTGKVDAKVSLDPFLAKDTERPLYRYHLSMAYTPHAEDSQWRVATLRFDNDFQHAPHALPSFDEGPNEVVYRDANESERELELIFGYGQE